MSRLRRKRKGTSLGRDLVIKTKTKKRKIRREKDPDQRVLMNRLTGSVPSVLSPTIILERSVIGVAKVNRIRVISSLVLLIGDVLSVRILIMQGELNATGVRLPGRNDISQNQTYHTNIFIQFFTSQHQKISILLI